MKATRYVHPDSICSKKLKTPQVSNKRGLIKEILSPYFSPLSLHFSGPLTAFTCVLFLMSLHVL